MRPGIELVGEHLRRKRSKGEFELWVERVEVPAGSTLAILGPSGSGKTTLLEILGLLERADEGRVLFDGRPVGVKDREARLQTAAVFQRPYLFKGSVAGNVEYGLVARALPKDERRKRVAAALERVGLAGYEARSAAALSGGEAQRVSLARALVLEPRLLLLDEPLASLDRLLRRRLVKDFATILADAGVTVVYVTHDQDEALVVADSIAIMNRGRIVACGPAEEISGLAADDWTADFLGIGRALEGRVASRGDGLFEVAVGDTPIVVSGDAPVGASVFVSVRPEDVLLFSPGPELPPTSARNRFEATVAAVEPHGATVLVTVSVDGALFASSVSRAAVADLALAPGVDVVVVFKASAVRWRLHEDEGRKPQENGV